MKIITLYLFGKYIDFAVDAQFVWRFNTWKWQVNKIEWDENIDPEIDKKLVNLSEELDSLIYQQLIKNNYK